MVSPKMRVAIVSPFEPFPGPTNPGAHVGGVERVLAEVSTELARRGHDVTLVCSTRGEPFDDDRGGVRVVRAQRRGTMLRTPLVDLARLVPQDTDVVHVPATYPLTTGRVLSRATRGGMASVLDFHFEPEPGHLVGRAAAGVYRRVGPRAYRKADAVLVRSMAYGRSAPGLAGVPEDRWRVVPNGIDVDRFRPAGRPGSDDYILFVGRLVPYKGLPVLIEALAALPGAPRLVVVGEGPLRPRLEAMARDRGLDVSFRGHVGEDELPRLYSQARLTVLPSVTRQEAFGIALIESMACGTPVVASDLPGVAEVARHGGLVARPGDAADLAAKVAAALEEGAIARGPRLAQTVRSAFSWQAVTDRIEAVYDEVVAPSDPRHAAPEQEVTPSARAGRRAVL